jgi:hypothetical protein
VLLVAVLKDVHDSADFADKIIQDGAGVSGRSA